ncbi:hypothetical protein D3C80_1293940 [compost metagenome]
MEMLSTPPATTMGIWSVMICLAAVAMAIRPDAHCRSIVMPATLTGKPAARDAVRPIVCWTPCGRAEPMMQSLISDGSIPARLTAAFSAWAIKLGDGVSLKAPR